ncbi:MAG: hypothetical protein QM655_12780 [Nocardioidaceae bacterium]
MTTPTAGPPTAPEEPCEHVEHGVVRPDPFCWMKRVGEPVFLDHLVAERRWYESATGHLRPLISELTAEMMARMPPTDPSVSWSFKGSSYYTKLPVGKEYRQLLRVRDLNEIDPGDEVLLDLNDFAAGDPGLGSYVEQGLCLLSPDASVLAYSVDLTGDEVYELRFRDLRTGEDDPTVCGAATTPAAGAPTAARSSTPFTTRPTGPTRSGATGSAPRPATCWCSRSRTSGSS